jgi:hypothetical protein
MNRTLTILIALIMIPCVSLAGEQEAQQTDLDELLGRYETQQKTSVSNGASPEAELRKLRNQLIDLRVERDGLREENNYLKAQLENEQTAGHEDIADCLDSGECVYVDDIENERIVSYVIYSLSLYRMAEQVSTHVPLEDVEAHKQAQKIMAGVKSDLDVLGFDTTNMHEYPSLDELLEEFQIAQQGSRSAR